MNAVIGAGWEPDEKYIREAEEQRRSDKIARDALVSALSEQDADFKVLAVDLTFTVGGLPSNPEYPEPLWQGVTGDRSSGHNQKDLWRHGAAREHGYVC